LFAFNDLMAMGAYPAVMERGLSIPGDISVVGYDDLELATFLFPALTTIRQPSFDLGLKAAEILIRHLEDKIEIPPLIQLMPELIVRDSVQ
jgi:LacI family transcriptional regulator